MDVWVGGKRNCSIVHLPKQTYLGEYLCVYIVESKRCILQRVIALYFYDRTHLITCTMHVRLLLPFITRFNVNSFKRLLNNNNVQDPHSTGGSCNIFTILQQHCALAPHTPTSIISTLIYSFIWPLSSILLYLLKMFLTPTYTGCWAKHIATMPLSVVAVARSYTGYPSATKRKT